MPASAAHGLIVAILLFGTGTTLLALRRATTTRDRLEYTLLTIALSIAAVPSLYRLLWHESAPTWIHVSGFALTLLTLGVIVHGYHRVLTLAADADEPESRDA